jgi:hypothetical protein
MWMRLIWGEPCSFAKLNFFTLQPEKFNVRDMVPNLTAEDVTICWLIRAILDFRGAVIYEYGAMLKTEENQRKTSSSAASSTMYPQIKPPGIKPEAPC